MPPDYPLFPSRDQMRDYILAFAAHHGLGSHVRFNTAVDSARPLDDDGLAGWEVTTSDGERRAYDGVIVANGHLWDPFVPELPRAASRGSVLHSGALPQRRRPRGRARARRRRRELRLRPRGRRGAGRPRDLRVRAQRPGLPAQDALRPAALGAAAARAACPCGCRSASRAGSSTSRSAGRSATGSRRPRRATCTATARSSTASSCTSSTTAASASRPASTRFDGHDVHFTDGTVRSVRHDRLRHRLQGVAAVPGPRAAPQRADGVPLRVAGMTLPVGAERLYFVGLAAPRGPQLPVYSAQARLIAQVPAAQERARRRAVAEPRATLAPRGADRHPAPRVAARHGPRAPAHRPRPAPRRRPAPTRPGSAHDLVAIHG